MITVISEGFRAEWSGASTVIAAIVALLAAGLVAAWGRTHTGRLRTLLKQLQSDIHRRDQEVRQHRENETKLVEALRIAGTGCWERDLLTNRINWTEGTASIVGMPTSSNYMIPTMFDTLIHPDDRERQQRALSTALNGDGPYEVQYRMITPDGSIRYLQVRGEVQRDQAQRPIRLFGTVQDVTGRVLADSALRQHAARMEVLARVTKAFSECRLDLQPALSTIVEQAMSVIGDGCIIALLSPDRTRFRAVAQSHNDTEAAALLEEALRRVPISEANASRISGSNGSPFPFLDPHFGWNASILKSGAGELLSVVDQDELQQKLHPGLLEFFARIEMHSVLSVPLRIEGQPLGILTLYRSTPGQPYTPDDLVLMQDLADRAALLVRNAEVHGKYKAGMEELGALSRHLLKVQEVERRSLARSLHDSVGQMLTAAKLGLEAARQSGDIAEARAHFGEIVKAIDDTLGAVRNLSLDLRPSILDDLGLASAIRWYLERHSRGLQIHAELNVVPMPTRPPQEVEIAYFRILQELWTNILRHAEAHHVSVELRATDDEFLMSITDDGQGFSVAEAEKKASQGMSLGLINIRERAALLGGSVEIHSAPGRGTTTIVRSPRQNRGREP